MNLAIYGPAFCHSANDQIGTTGRQIERNTWTNGQLRRWVVGTGAGHGRRPGSEWETRPSDERKHWRWRSKHKQNKKQTKKMSYVNGCLNNRHWWKVATCNCNCNCSRLLTDAVATAGRFANINGPCVWGAGAGAPDSLGRANESKRMMAAPASALGKTI